MLKAILFDLDGTLINTNDLIRQSFRHAFKICLNKEVDEAVITSYFGKPLNVALGEYGDEAAEILMKTFKEFNEEMHDELSKEFEGVVDALTVLKKRGYKLGIVTSKRKLMADRSLKLINIYDYMDIIITPEDTDKHKPDPDPIYKACEKLNIRSEEALMVGDSIYDIQCGKNAGAKTCAVTYTEFPLEELLSTKPDYTVDKLIELLNVVDSI